MTAETDLLPLPKVLAHWISLHAAHAADSADVRGFVEHYARANLAELQREVEGLRAEVERLRRDRDDCLAARKHYASLYGEQHGRAERLAEALRDLLNVSDKFTGDPDEDAATWVAANDAARAAQDQETTNG